MASTNCDPTYFPMTDYSRAEAIGISRYSCPSVPEIELWGDLGSKNSRFFAITFWKCRGGSNCKSSWQLMDWAVDKPVKLAFLNSYFDGKTF